MTTMSFLRQSGPLIVNVVAGLATGAGIYIIYYRLSRDIGEIRALLFELKKAIEIINAANHKKRSRNSSYYSTVSSGEEDDDFEDALAGFSDVELVGRPSSSSERNVQFATPLTTEMTTEGSDQQFYATVDAFIETGGRGDYDQAYAALQERLPKMLHKAQFQWRLAKVAYFLASAAEERGDLEGKKDKMYEAKDAAQAAINLDSKCANAHKWYAITLGCVGDYVPTSEKIKNAVIIKEHIQKAIDLNPKDPTPYHMLGRWCYSVYMLSWIERKAAAAFFGSPPTSTVEEALGHFLEAERLQPKKWKENSLYIAKCYIEKREYSEAVNWLREAQAPADGVDPDEVQKQVKALLAKYNR